MIYIMKRLKLTNGGYTILDDDDYKKFSKYNWQRNYFGYAERCLYLRNANLSKGVNRSINKHLFLHRLVNNTPDNFDTDHINRDKLDNRKANLRTVTRSTNMHNKGKIKNNSRSKLQGVQWRKDRKKWRSYICIDYKDIYLGSYDSELDAHSVYLSAKEQLL